MWANSASSTNDTTATVCPLPSAKEAIRWRVDQDEDESYISTKWTFTARYDTTHWADQRVRKKKKKKMTITSDIFPPSLSLLPIPLKEEEEEEDNPCPCCCCCCYPLSRSSSSVAASNPLLIFILLLLLTTVGGCWSCRIDRVRIRPQRAEYQDHATTTILLFKLWIINCSNCKLELIRGGTRAETRHYEM